MHSFRVPSQITSHIHPATRPPIYSDIGPSACLCHVDSINRMIESLFCPPSIASIPVRLSQPTHPHEVGPAAHNHFLLTRPSVEVSIDGVSGQMRLAKMNIRGPLVTPIPLSETGSAPTHNLALADQLGTEFGTVQREVDVEVHTVEGALRGIPALEVLLQVLP